ncbi:YidC/Oxa1 family membrane protein insertase [Candidatus Pacearchaeota archaeon]|nr:YidC/Oxa1 family membrane protein insertase [Candidatus Pacearchaeota archaeon]
MQNKLSRFLFFFLIFLIIFQIFSRNTEGPTNNDDIVISSKGKTIIGKVVSIDIKNNGLQTIDIQNKCPKNPLLVEIYSNGEWIEKGSETDTCNPENELIAEIKPEKSSTISFDAWSHEIFNEVGKYRITLETTLGEKTKQYFHEINVSSPSFIRQGWNSLLYKPIFNTLIYFVSKLPGHSLGWAIFLLTFLIKLLLLGPNHKALKSQKALQKIQPQLDALKQKYKNDSQKLSQETMKIWKKHKVNPMGSCLPMLIQFPILIALFYVVRDGLGVTDPNLFYEPLRAFNLQNINPIFLGIIDLTKANKIALPLIVGGMQFFQIRLSLAKTKGANQNAAMPMMNNMMQFFLPVMIAVFTASLPAAVGFYWGTSTLFAIGQQLVVNRAKD